LYFISIYLHLFTQLWFVVYMNACLFNAVLLSSTDTSHTRIRTFVYAFITLFILHTLLLQYFLLQSNNYVSLSFYSLAESNTGHILLNLFSHLHLNVSTYCPVFLPPFHLHGLNIIFNLF